MRPARTCTICEQRKAKRYCTARGEDICAQCCATERETTINCPYECSYLRESRAHERRQWNGAEVPYREVRLDDEFLRQSELLTMLMAGFFDRALRPEPNATDRDAREALDALISSYRERREVVPAGAVAAGIAGRFRERLEGFVDRFKNEDGGVLGDEMFVGVLVVMARVAYVHDNGRPSGRAYVHYLRSAIPMGKE